MLDRKWYSALPTSFLGTASVEGNPLELGFAVPQQPISNREQIRKSLEFDICDANRSRTMRW
jgi:hypothetical protein